MKKLLALVLTSVLVFSCLTACDWFNTNQGVTRDDVFIAYTHQVTKDEFQKEYAQAFNTLQPDYKKDFVYTYTNYSTEIYENGEDKQTTVERREYDAESQILLYHYEFQSNDQDMTINESYFWEYREEDGMLLFYDSRTNNSEARTLGFEEFWEFAHNQVPLVLFPNPNKLFNDSIYYVDLDEEGNTVFTLYSGESSDYSLRQMTFGKFGMIYRSKSYSKEDDYEDTTVDIYRVYNEDVTLTPHS